MEEYYSRAGAHSLSLSLMCILSKRAGVYAVSGAVISSCNYIAEFLDCRVSMFCQVSDGYSSLTPFTLWLS